MSRAQLAAARVRRILAAAAQSRILVVGDVMLDHFIWGSVARISPEAPVPVVDFERENFMPGGAANVARNLAALNARTELFGIVGQDRAAQQLKSLLAEHHIGCRGLLGASARPTSVKTRIVAHKQQVVRIDRETRDGLDGALTHRLAGALELKIKSSAAVIVGDYGKGVVTQPLLDELKRLCRQHGVWLSVDPKPVHHLNLAGLSLITPNRKEAFDLANLADETRNHHPLADANLTRVADRLLKELRASRCSPPHPPPTGGPPAQVFGRFQIQRELGRGGFGEGEKAVAIFRSGHLLDDKDGFCQRGGQEFRGHDLGKGLEISGEFEA